MQINEQADNTSISKQPWKAVFLTSLFTGAGHLYSGAMSRGIFLIALAITLYGIMAAGVVGFLVFKDKEASRIAMFFAIAALPILFVLQIFALFDAYKVTKKFNADQNLPAENPGHRKSWLSVFLSDIFPGIGQFYNRQIFKGIAFAAAAIGVSVAADRYYPLFIPGIALYFFSIKDAYDSAEKYNGSSNRFLYQGTAFLIFVLVMLFLGSMPYGPIIRDNLLKAYRIPAGSMLPTLRIGDHLLIDKTKEALDALKPGDIVVFPYPENPEKNFIKRAIAFGGDKVQFINGDLYINDQIVQKKFIHAEEVEGTLPPGYSKVMVYEEQLGNHIYRIQYLRDHGEYNAGPWVVPENEVFVMGDNRDNSMDSRVWGPVSKDTIEGKALKIYWSWDRAAAKTNWERIGVRIR